jgi:ABC-type multidrug transport system fused ATPase/permease subunit
LAATAATLVPPYLTMPLMDDILIPYQNGKAIDPGLVSLYLLGLLGAALLAWGLGWAKTYILALVSERIGADLRTTTYEHLLKLSLEYFGDRRTGDLIARIGNETDRINVFLSLHLLDFATDVLMIVMTASILISIDPKLAAATLLPLFLGAGVTLAICRLDRTRFAVRGVVGPYFAAVALLFSLYASLMAGEVWQKSAHVASLTRSEVTAMRAAIHIAEGLHPDDHRVRDMLTLVKSTPVDTARGVTDLPPADPMQALYALAADSTYFAASAAANAAFYSALDDISATRRENQALRSVRLSGEKLFTLLLFGFITQIAIAYCHGGNARALGTAVMLFSVAFAAAVSVLELMDMEPSLAPLIH